MSTTPPRQIVCDTGPLISLEKITGGYRFIWCLYDRLLVPPAVGDSRALRDSKNLCLSSGVVWHKLF